MSMGDEFWIHGCKITAERHEVYKRLVDSGEAKIQPIDCTDGFLIVDPKTLKYHCLEAPSEICSDGSEYWTKQGELHRDPADGPAVKRLNGTVVYYKDGVYLGEVPLVAALMAEPLIAPLEEPSIPPAKEADGGPTVGLAAGALVAGIILAGLFGRTKVPARATKPTAKAVKKEVPVECSVEVK